MNNWELRYQMEKNEGRLKQFRSWIDSLGASLTTKNPAGALAAAASSATPAAELDRLCAVNDASVLAAIAANPNVSKQAFDYAGQRAPAAALSNPLLEVWSFTEPDWMWELSRECGLQMMGVLYAANDIKRLTSLFPEAFRKFCADWVSETSHPLHLDGYRDPSEEVCGNHASSIGDHCARGRVVSQADLDIWMKVKTPKILNTIARSWRGPEGLHERLYSEGGEDVIKSLIARTDCPAAIIEKALTSGNPRLSQIAAANSNLELSQQLRLAHSSNPQVWLNLMGHGHVQTIEVLYQQLDLLPFLLAMKNQGFAEFARAPADVAGFTQWMHSKVEPSTSSTLPLRVDFYRQRWEFGPGCLAFLAANNIFPVLQRLSQSRIARNRLLEKLASSSNPAVREGLFSFFTGTKWGQYSNRRIALLRQLQQDPVERIRLMAIGHEAIEYVDVQAMLRDPSPRVRAAYVRAVAMPKRTKADKGRPRLDFGQGDFALHFVNDSSPRVRLAVLDKLLLAYTRGYKGGLTHLGITAECLIEQLVAAAPDKQAAAKVIARAVKADAAGAVQLPLAAIDPFIAIAPDLATQALQNCLSVGVTVKKFLNEFPVSTSGFHKLAGHPSIYLKAVAARHFRTPPEVLRELANHPHPLVQAALKNNRRAASILRKAI